MIFSLIWLSHRCSAYWFVKKMRIFIWWFCLFIYILFVCWLQWYVRFVYFILIGFSSLFWLLICSNFDIFIRLFCSLIFCLYNWLQWYLSWLSEVVFVQIVVFFSIFYLFFLHILISFWSWFFRLSCLWDGARSGGSWISVAYSHEVQEDSDVWKVSEGTTQTQVETSQADYSSWELPKLSPWWTKLWVYQFCLTEPSLLIDRWGV